VRHEEAWRRLPDLLDDRDDGDLLTHVRGCAACQRQLFLLGRVDRLLQESAVARRAMRRRLPVARIAAGAVALAAAAAAMLALFLPQPERTHEFRLRTASGRLVGDAELGGSDARNVSLSFSAHHLPVDRGDIFVLWAGDGRASLQVGRFMVDATGGCRVHFNIPATRGWHRFWVTGPGQAAAVVAST
jgi:hypothetical protein